MKERTFPHDPSEEQASRRSKMEMVCEILAAMSAGTKRPTRIMQRANLTWTALLMYLDVLVRNGFVSRQFEGKMPTYLLTPRGVAALKHYQSLKGELSVLRLDSVNAKSLVTALKTEVAGSTGSSPKARLVEKLKKEGMEIFSGPIVGRSGVKHEYDVVARSANGQTHVYAIVYDENDNHILSMQAKQLDTGTISHVLYSGEATPGALALARGYNIELTKW